MFSVCRHSFFVLVNEHTILVLILHFLHTALLLSLMVAIRCICCSKMLRKGCVHRFSAVCVRYTTSVSHLIIYRDLPNCSSLYYTLPNNFSRHHSLQTINPWAEYPCWCFSFCFLHCGPLSHNHHISQFCRFSVEPFHHAIWLRRNSCRSSSSNAQYQDGSDIHLWSEFICHRFSFLTWNWIELSSSAIVVQNHKHVFVSWYVPSMDFLLSFAS